MPVSSQIRAFATSLRIRRPWPRQFARQIDIRWRRPITSDDASLRRSQTGPKSRDGTDSGPSCKALLRTARDRMPPACATRFRGDCAPVMSLRTQRGNPSPARGDCFVAALLARTCFLPGGVAHTPGRHTPPRNVVAHPCGIPIASSLLSGYSGFRFGNKVFCHRMTVICAGTDGGVMVALLMSRFDGWSACARTWKVIGRVVPMEDTGDNSP
jgi:hypothetical protein